MSDVNVMKKILNVLSVERLEEIKNDMSRYQKNLFDKLLNDDELASSYSLNDLLFDFDKEFVEMILEVEIQEYLKESNDKDNKRNGYTRDIELNIGNRTINFNRPRLRNESDFDSKFIPKRTRILKDITENIILLYSKNNSINDIQEILRSMFNIDVSTGYISNITQKISDKVLIWRCKELQKCYFTLNIDCTYVTIRDNKKLCSHKVPIYIAIGTTLSGHKEVVGLYIGNEDENKNVIDELYNKDIGESKTFWLTVFNDLKDRGLEKVLFIVSDGLCGIKEAINAEFPDSKYQRCVVHLVRDLKKYTTSTNRKEVIKDFKTIYTSTSLEEAELKYQSFIEKYAKSKTMIKKVEEYFGYIKTLFNETINVRKYIYTNNIVESANSKVKRGFYGRGALPNTSSAINIAYLNLIDLENKWEKKQVNNWANISRELTTVYYDKIKDYLEG